MKQTKTLISTSLSRKFSLFCLASLVLASGLFGCKSVKDETPEDSSLSAININIPKISSRFTAKSMCSCFFVMKIPTDENGKTYCERIFGKDPNISNYSIDTEDKSVTAALKVPIVDAGGGPFKA